MTSQQVVIHNNERIRNLLCGKQQHIGSSLSKKPEEYDFTKDEVDFSKFHFPEEINQISLNRNPNHRSNSQNSVPITPENGIGFDERSKMKEYNKLKSNAATIENINNYLSVYDINAKRKKQLLHQEVEDKYLHPLSRKLVKKTSGLEYNKYIRSKTRAVTAFDHHARMKDNLTEPTPQIPHLKLDVSDLTDPIVRYKKNQEHENRLKRIIQQSTNQVEEVKTYPERDAMNLKKWKILSETRFYDGDPDSPNNMKMSKGKKIYANKFKSDVEAQFDNFAPPVEKQPYIQRNRPEYMKDHVVFDMA